MKQQIIGNIFELNVNERNFFGKIEEFFFLYLASADNRMVSSSSSSSSSQQQRQNGEKKSVKDVKFLFTRELDMTKEFF